MKELIINGKVFAKYEIGYEGKKEFENVLFLKVLKKIYPADENLSEQAIINIIQLVEGKTFKAGGYLNV